MMLLREERRSCWSISGCAGLSGFDRVSAARALSGGSEQRLDCCSPAVFVWRDPWFKFSSILSEMARL